MADKPSGAFPYKSLGTRLRQLREKMQENLAEVSGAVEIDAAQLTEIERGTSRPAEDILLLLITHFSVKDDEATKLWELAGYDQQKVPAANLVNDTDGSVKQAVMVMPMETRIVYTDMVHVMVNNYGVVMNFMQGTGTDTQPLAVARIGMSKEHARSVLELLQKTLAQTEPKALPHPDSSSSSDKQIKK